MSELFEYLGVLTQDPTYRKALLAAWGALVFFFVRAYFCKDKDII